METLLRKYWDGTITAHEKDILLRYLSEVENDYSSIGMEKFSFVTKEDNKTIHDEEKYEKLLALLHEKIGSQDQKSKLQKRNGGNKLWFWAAACILFIMGFVFFFPKDHNAYYKRNIVSKTMAVTDIVKANDKDSSIHFELVDGTLVELAAHSVVKYTSEYNKSKRDILLESGSARFEVAKNPHKPFSVTAKGIVTTALGTSFSVNISRKQKTSIKLFHGKISVQRSLLNGKPAPIIYLFPGESIEFNAANNILVKGKIEDNQLRTESPIVAGDSVRNVNVANLKLVFYKESIVSCLKKIGLLYKTKMIYSSKDLEGLWFTGSFEKNATIDEVLKTICSVNDLSYSIENEKIIIQSN
ncbi:MAG: hypothetical protein DI598_00460 [Pseudopedobacter saltans]|uniref:Anti-FecI sigma factor, FecR n=1 Tax=Pseudopedobacter saltans TaxID=151895 RepID=A0A2W5F909_9SPHI|nr:MAG: hypothetical protein DI598_00460 [Pseudopedobacter saltans]